MSRSHASGTPSAWSCTPGACAPPAPAALNARQRAADSYRDTVAVAFRGGLALPVAVGVAPAHE